MMKYVSVALTKFLPISAATVWILLVITGLVTLRKYDLKPGPFTVNPVVWPAKSAVPSTNGITLMLFVHPRCPCSRATIGELALLMAQCENRARAYVLFYRPKNSASGWEQTDIWHSAAIIPGVHVLCDVDGAEARRFHVFTSGHALLYDAEGRLLFSGGITRARGHCGDNAGRSAIVTTITTGRRTLARTPVFGCSLRGSSERDMDKE